MHSWFTQTKPDGLLIVPIASHMVCRVCLYKKIMKAPNGYEFILIDVLCYAPFTAMVQGKPIRVK